MATEVLPEFIDPEATALAVARGINQAQRHLLEHARDELLFLAWSNHVHLHTLEGEEPAQEFDPTCRWASCRRVAGLLASIEALRTQVIDVGG